MERLSETARRQLADDLRGRAAGERLRCPPNEPVARALEALAIEMEEDGFGILFDGPAGERVSLDDPPSWRSFPHRS